VPDDRFAAYTQMPFYAALLRACRRAGFTFECGFSYITHTYTAEIITIERFERSAQPYILKHNNAFDEHPLLAIARAIRESGRETLLLTAVLLEIEVQVLRETVMRAQRNEQRLEQLLDALAKLLERVARQPKTWDEVFSDMEKTEHGTFVDRKGIEAAKTPRPLPAAPDEDDDL
jgi:hypothetical protein